MSPPFLLGGIKTRKFKYIPESQLICQICEKFYQTGSVEELHRIGILKIGQKQVIQVETILKEKPQT